HRFFEGTGIVMPVAFSGSWNDLRPRFNAGDDVVRSGAFQDASRTFQQSRTFTTSFSRSWNERSNPFLRYTVGGLSGGYSQSDGLSKTPTGRGTAQSRGWSVLYGISPRRLLTLGVPLS